VAQHGSAESFGPQGRKCRRMQADAGGKCGMANQGEDNSSHSRLLDDGKLETMPVDELGTSARPGTKGLHTTERATP
jgi:hypothetical protein